MGQVKGFLQHKRKDFEKRSVKERLCDYDELYHPMAEQDLKDQAARCMDCGIPFCHWGCPVDNLIPEWNDLAYQGRWQEAFHCLMKTNNFPEFTGRICPAPCENSCVLSINEGAVSIKNIELTIIEKAYQNGWVKPKVPKKRLNKTVAIVGSGPAGLACADQLNAQGYKVTVFEKNNFIGGILLLGIPAFKLAKEVVNRRVKLMQKEGIVFKTKVNIGVDISVDDLKKQFDAVVLTAGAEHPRNLPVEGRDLTGIHFAMDYLTQQTKELLGNHSQKDLRIDAKDKNVVVLGGGDTGSDCVGTANRQGAKSVKQFELLPRPPEVRDEDNPWPQWANVYRQSTSHEEGVDQDFCIMTKSFSGEGGQVKKLQAVRLEFGKKDPATGRRPMKEIPGSEFEMDCDLVFLAMGFLGPVKEGLINKLGLELDQRGNIITDAHYMTSVEGVFAAGDARIGQSLVVKAIKEGRNAAVSVGQYFSNIE